MLDLIGWLSYVSFFLVFSCAFAIITLGLNLQWGFTGLFNVGVAGFVAVGAYTSALLTTPDAAGPLKGLAWPVAAGMLAAMGVTGLVELVVGALALRLRQDYLAITTFGIAVTISRLGNQQTGTGALGVVLGHQRRGYGTRRAVAREGCHHDAVGKLQIASFEGREKEGVRSRHGCSRSVE